MRRCVLAVERSGELAALRKNVKGFSLIYKLSGMEE